MAGLPFLHSRHEDVLKQLFGAFGAVDTVAVHKLQASAGFILPRFKLYTCPFQLVDADANIFVSGYFCLLRIS